MKIVNGSNAAAQFTVTDIFLAASLIKKVETLF